MPEKDHKKLFPLRKISCLGIISDTYLSILAQRGKLKTKKIGRNYYTTIEWFNDYLLKHAKEEVPCASTSCVTARPSRAATGGERTARAR